jgi:hypothetical protein
VAITSNNHVKTGSTVCSVEEQWQKESIGNKATFESFTKKLEGHQCFQKVIPQDALVAGTAWGADP